MSDVFEGPGYWMASDGKWYAPGRHPDPSYRARFVTDPVVPEFEPVAVADPTTTQPRVESQAENTEPAQGEFPSVGLDASATSSTVASTTPLSDIHRTVSDVEDISSTTEGSEGEDIGDDETVPAVADEFAQPSDAGSDLAGVPEANADSVDASEPRTTAPVFSVGAPKVSALPERPVFDMTPPASVTTPLAGRVDQGAGNRVELEIARDAPSGPRRTSSSGTGPVIAPTPSTSLAVPPQSMTEVLPATNLDRLIAAAIFASGVAMIVGTFLEWTTGSLVQTGWDRGDGIATIIAGIVGSAAAGPIYVGYRHIIPKSVAIVAGLVGLVVVGLTAIGVLFDSASADTSIGLGFIVVFVGSTIMAIAGLADRGEVLA